MKLTEGQVPTGEQATDFELGRPYVPWRDGAAKSVTFIVTEDCQLRCRYCYLVHKRPGRVMDFGVAAKTIDYLLDNPHLFPEQAVVWEFIGGEPLLEIELINKICDYAKLRMYQKNHPWFDNYRISMSTNGLCYAQPNVQRFIKKNHRHLGIGVTIDGTRQKHDANRVFPDGRGSYDLVVKNIPLWIQQFPKEGTKATVAHDDLPYLAESVLHLWSLGIRNIYINVVFEDVWKPGDDEIFERQLCTLADHIVENELYREHNFTFFTCDLGRALDPLTENRSWCGAGRMLAVDAKGTFYPCVRFAPYSLVNREPITIGNCFEGINLNRLRPFLSLNRIAQSPPECVTCEVASGCASCVAANYDYADSDTIYQRSVSICKMHKARVRANAYYWHKLNAKLKLEQVDP